MRLLLLLSLVALGRTPLAAQEPLLRHGLTNSLLLTVILVCLFALSERQDQDVKRAGIEAQQQVAEPYLSRCTWCHPAAEPGSEADPMLRRSLNEALDSLPPQTRVAVLLRFVDGHSYVEIAKMTGEKESTLKMRVARGMRRVRTHIGFNHERR